MVDLFVGSDDDDHLSTWWPHLLGVPHHQAHVLCHDHQALGLPGRNLPLGGLLDSEGPTEDDTVSLLAAQLGHTQQPALELPHDRPPEAIMDNRDTARDIDDLSPASSGAESPSLSPMTPVPIGEAWYSTLVYTLDGGPSAIW